MKIRVVKRDKASKLLQIVTPFIAILLSFAFVGIFLILNGLNPILVFKDMFVESLGSFYGFSETLVKTTPLILCGLGVALAFRMELWNIGAEGQLYMGAFGASLIALFFNINNHFLMILLMFLSAVVFSGLWGLIAGFLKAKWSVNEIIVTLLMNYIAILWVDYLVYGPWKDPGGFNFPLTKQFSDVARLSYYFNTRLHTGFFIAIVLVFLFYILIEKTVWGYEIRVIGNNPNAAKYAGINYEKNVILVMFISGALAGIAGFSEVAGVTYRLQHSISPGYGYTAIIVAWLAKRSALGVLLVSFVMGVLFVGNDALQISYQLPIAFVNAFQGLILFFVISSEFFVNYKIKFGVK
ncbi:sugar ABC transporter, permease [Deferribacter desulfuricans SSM1]|uniref:Sugar ABC transporter, permease n=1 Tax=Deferribacter desulfuricans (strain DSM 14783 / JCM 11476 / NBRC 101012 / SSM1) TaxID=639282 RepID=D3PCX7_DEFDS|nr:ABC transporter permease [Deferribacter desulfuricans]BAI80450.1 sugar ABC transporter, permease [Deferribacter desulfuricans SSM1]